MNKEERRSHISVPKSKLNQTLFIIWQDICEWFCKGYQWKNKLRVTEMYCDVYCILAKPVPQLGCYGADLKKKNKKKTRTFSCQPNGRTVSLYNMPTCCATLR